MNYHQFSRRPDREQRRAQRGAFLYGVAFGLLLAVAILWLADLTIVPIGR